MSAPCLIYDDPREIASIWFPGEGAGGWQTARPDAHFGCSRIVAYREHGQGDYVPYYAVYRGEEIIARVPASFVAVHYAPAPTATPADAVEASNTGEG